MVFERRERDRGGQGKRDSERERETETERGGIEILLQCMTFGIVTPRSQLLALSQDWTAYGYFVTLPLMPEGTGLG